MAVKFTGEVDELMQLIKSYMSKINKEDQIRIWRDLTDTLNFCWKYFIEHKNMEDDRSGD